MFQSEAILAGPLKCSRFFKNSAASTEGDWCSIFLGLHHLLSVPGQIGMGSQSLPWPLVYDHPPGKMVFLEAKGREATIQGQPLICGPSSACSSTYTTSGSCQPEPKDSLIVKGPGLLGSKWGWVNIQLLLSKAHWFLKGAKHFRLEEMYLPASGPVEESP